jgi:hypothetical protein
MPQSLTGRQVPSADETKRETEGIVSVASANGKVTNYTVEKWQAEINKEYELARVISRALDGRRKRSLDPYLIVTAKSAPGKSLHPSVSDSPTVSQQGSWPHTKIGLHYESDARV